MRVMLVHNPEAGERDPSGERLMAVLRQAGHEGRYQAAKLRDLGLALDEAADVVAIAGGDGTVSRVAGFMSGRDVPCAILPVGTANNIATSLGHIGTPEDLVRRWEGAPRQTFDTWGVRGPWGTARMLEAFGIGLFGERVAADSDDDGGGKGNGKGKAKGKNGGKGNGDSRRDVLHEHLAALKKRAKSCPALKVSVSADGEDLSGEYLLVEAMNLPVLGPNVPLAHSADPGDERLELVLLPADERKAFVHYIEAMLEQDDDGDGDGEAGPRRTLIAPEDVPSGLIVKCVQRVHIAWDGSPAHLDGRPAPGFDQPTDGDGHAEAEITPAASGLVFLDVRGR